MSYMIDRKITHTYLVLVAITIIALYVVQRFDIAYPLNLRTSQVTSELSVVGEGKIDVTPDTATIDVGISVTNAKTAPEAQAQIDEINNKIIASMESLGIKKEDIQTSNYSIYPNTVYNPTSQRETASGYNGSVTVSIKATDVDKSSLVVDEATKAGANQIQGVRFSVEHPEVYREKARDEAIANAKQQADRLAKSLGIKLGKVSNIVESSNNAPQPYMYALEAKSADSAAGPRIEPGTQTISSVVTLYFEKR